MGARGVEVNSTEYANKLNEAKTELWALPSGHVEAVSIPEDQNPDSGRWQSEKEVRTWGDKI